DFSSVGRNNVLKLDGVLGLGLLEEVAWAIVPSAGVVHFTRSIHGQGDALVVATGTQLSAPEDGPAAHFSPSVSYRVEGKKSWTGTSLSAWLDVGGSPSQMAITFAPIGMKITPEAVEDPAVLGSIDGVDSGLVSVNTGETTVEVVARFDKAYTYHQQFLSDTNKVHGLDGVLGRDLLGQYDIAFNVHTGALSLSKYEQNNRLDPVPLILADDEAALKQAIETPPEAEEEVAKDTSLPAGTAKAWQAVARAREASGDFQGAMDAWKTTAQFEPNDCEGWLNYGLRVLEFTATPSDAREALTKASQQYHAWWDWAPEVRVALTEIIEKADEENADYYFQPDDVDFIMVNDIREHDVAMGAPAPRLPETGMLVRSQQDTCDYADGLLARIALLEGDFATVEQLYEDTFDLDRYVADLYGAASIVNGEPKRAHEPLRQALIREWWTGPSGHRRAVLAQAYIAQGDRETASKLLQRATEISNSYMVQRQWMLNAIEVHGLEETARKAEAEARLYPNSNMAQHVWLAIEQQVGNDAKIAEATERAEQALRRDELHYPNGSGPHFAAAHLSLLKGELDDAEASAKKACELGPQYGSNWAIAAEIAAAQGDSEAEAAFIVRAAQASPLVVEYLAKALAETD
ncbi:MAG TPA: hypothetical protein DFR83_19875, partial [Deltaproteobacteria bacterium]|nr:hypothetical protein [Deltaproteobacteria bacterium]